MTTNNLQTYPGAVAGYRLMRLRPEGVGPPMMLSITNLMGGASYEWRPGETNVAVCGRGHSHAGQRIPAYYCMCGFWTFKSLELLKQRLSVTGPGWYAYVLMAGWGKVVEHEAGTRTEFARPLAILDEGPPGQLLRVDADKWNKYVGKIDLPMVDAAELGLAAQMYELEMLEVTEPATYQQLLWANGMITFERADEIEQLRMAEGEQAFEVLEKPGANAVNKRSSMGFTITPQTIVHGHGVKTWQVLGVDMATDRYNAAMLQRLMLSPDSAGKHRI